MGLKNRHLTIGAGILAGVLLFNSLGYAFPFFHKKNEYKTIRTLEQSEQEYFKKLNKTLGDITFEDYIDSTHQEEVKTIKEITLDGVTKQIEISEKDLIKSRSNYETSREDQHYVMAVKDLEPTYENNVILKSICDSTKIDDMLKQLGVSSDTKEQTAKKIMDLVHSLKFEEHDDTQTPVETLANGTGVCRDFTILGYEMLRRSGINAVQIYITPTDSTKKGHALLGVAGNFKGTYIEHNGQKYYLAETTIPLSIGYFPKKTLENLEKDSKVRVASIADLIKF